MKQPRLYHHMAVNHEECIKALELEGQPTFPGFANGTYWCNATWDTFLCWPAIPANSSYTLPCPPLRGLIPEKRVYKYCHESAQWAGRDELDFSTPFGYTDYIPCMKIDFLIFEKAQQIASDARKLEYVGLSLSLISLIMAIVIFSAFRRLRVFRNQIHQQLMLAILLNVILRLVLYIDLALSKDIGPWIQGSDSGYTINSTRILCELFYLLLEYLKTVAFAFCFIEGFYLHNTIVVQVFQATEPKFCRYLVLGWGIPAIHVSVWVSVIMLMRKDFQLERCLGDYYMQTEYWIMDGVRLLELVVNFVFLLNIVRVLWLKVKETQNTTELEHLKKSVKAALMLIPLLGIPNIMQTIPFTPTRNNIIYFAVFTYCASFFFMFQGLMVAVLYCFTNKEVITVIKSKWNRYRLRHQSVDRLRRGSRTVMTANNDYVYRNYHDQRQRNETPYASTDYTVIKDQPNQVPSQNQSPRANQQKCPPPTYATVFTDNSNHHQTMNHSVNSRNGSAAVLVMKENNRENYCQSHELNPLVEQHPINSGQLTDDEQKLP